MDKLFTSLLLTTAASGGQADAAAGGGISMLFSLGFMVIIFAVMYFLMIRPQKKKEKAVKAMLDALKVGDRVLTSGGIYGTVTGVKDDHIIIAHGAGHRVLIGGVTRDGIIG